MAYEKSDIERATRELKEALDNFLEAIVVELEPAMNALLAWYNALPTEVRAMLEKKEEK